MEIAKRYCTFCGAPREEAEFLIADEGSTVSICVGCIERSRDTVGYHRIAKEFSELFQDAKRYRFIRDEPWAPELASAIQLQMNADWDRLIDEAINAQLAKEKS